MKKLLSRLRLYCSVEVEVLVAGPCLLNRLHAREGYPVPFYRHQSKPTLVLAEQTNGPTRLRLDAVKAAGKVLMKIYLLLLVLLGWLGWGDFGLAPRSYRTIPCTVE